MIISLFSLFMMLFLYFLCPVTRVSIYLSIHSTDIYWKQTNMSGTGGHMEKKIESLGVGKGRK